jgi:curved DNA-binding protein CbpA
MTADYFALLGLPRSVTLEDDVLQKAYLSKTRDAHPDQTAGDSLLSTELNAARDTLGSTARRLKHFFELEQSGQPPVWGVVPLDHDMMRVFEKLGPAIQSATALIRELEGAKSALSKALLSDRVMRQRESLEAVGDDLDVLSCAMLATLPELDRRREAGDAAVMRDIHQAQARFAYLEKWRAQICEVLAKLF